MACGDVDAKTVASIWSSRRAEALAVLEFGGPQKPRKHDAFTHMGRAFIHKGGRGQKTSFCRIQWWRGMPPSTWGVGDRPGGGDMSFNGGGDMPPSTEEVGDRSNGGGGTDPMAEGTCLHPRGRSGTEDLLLPDLMAEGTCLHPRRMSGAEDLLLPNSMLLRCPVLACSYLDHHPRIWYLALSLDCCATSLGEQFPGHLAAADA